MAQETKKVCVACSQEISGEHFSVYSDHKGVRTTIDVHEGCASFVFSENLLKNYVEKVAKPEV